MGQIFGKIRGKAAGKMHGKAANRTILLGAFGLTVLAGACGRGELLGTLAGPLDASNTDGAASSAPRFSPPQLVQELSDPLALDGDPTLTGDLLELFFTSNRGGTMDIWTSRRSTTTDAWGAPTVVSTLSSPFADYGPAVSLDGLRIWFTTDRDPSPGRIWRSSRTTRLSAFAAPAPVTELASGAKDFSPAVDATETTLMFGANRLGAQGFDIYFCTRVSANVPWGTARQVPGVNGPFDDWDPFVAQGGLVIFFTSMRQGAGDIFWSARQSITAAFPTPVPLADVNSAAYDSDPTLSPDLTYMLFDSMRSGNSDIYETHAIP